MADVLTIEILTPDDAAFAAALADVAALRIEVFRAFPYLYDGSPEYERAYLQTYLDCPDSVMVLARDGDRIVGASTGLPMAAADPEFAQPFVESAYDGARVFYCGESVLLPAYRGRGAYRAFFAGRERRALDLGEFDLICFSAVQRPADHPRRPADYRDLGSVWRHFGYREHPELSATYTWKDVDDPDESPKRMVYWLKSLR